MKRFYVIGLLALGFCSTIACRAQNDAKDSIVGTWKGTSLCQVKPSSCHDENVVCHITNLSGQTYTMEMNKVVNGEEEEMGALDAEYDASKGTLSFTVKDLQGRTNDWLVKIDRKKMHGTLTINKKTLFRIIELEKTQ